MEELYIVIHMVMWFLLMSYSIFHLVLEGKSDENIIYLVVSIFMIVFGLVSVGFVKYCIDIII